MSYFDDASLVMIPSGYKTSKVYSVKPTSGDGDLTFTRSNDTATRVGPDGLIEKVRTNQIRNSSMVGASAPSTIPTNWVITTGGLTFTVIGTGTEDGLTYIEINASGTASSSNARIAFDSSTQILGATGQYWTNSFYFKTVSETIAPNAYGLAIFENTSAGSLVTTNVLALTPTSNLERYSYSVLTSGGGTVARVQPYARFTLTLGNSYDFTFRIAAPQMEQGDIATDYIATTTAAVSVGPVANVPRLDYLNSSCPRLLLEPQRTNLIQYSEQFNNAWWSPSNSTISANAVTSPDGYTNADNLVENTANSTHGVGNVSGLTLTAAAYTFSVFVKKQNRNFFAISTYDGSSTLEGYFNINTGAVATMPAGLTGAITSYGNGWYRCSVTRTMGNNANNYFSFNAAATDGGSTYTGTGVVACSIYGGSLELGAYATSYIPTLGAAVTRGADACSKTGISSLIGQTQGTLFVEVDTNVLGSVFSGTSRRFLTISDNTLNNRIIVLQSSLNDSIQFIVVSGGVEQANISTSANQSGIKKIAVGYANNDFVLYVNGVQIGTDTSGTVPACSRLAIGVEVDFVTSNPACPVSQALLFPTRLSNADLAALTA